MNNLEFSEKNVDFLEACNLVKVLPYYGDFKPSRRQAGKWRRGTGIAYKTWLRRGK